MSFDVEGASARSFSLAPPARCLFQSPPPFRATDEGAVGAVLDANDIRREDEKREQWETMNVDAQEAVWGLLSMGSAHNHNHFHQDEHQNRHHHYRHHSHNSNSPTTSSSSSRTRPAVTLSAARNSILTTTTTSPHIPSSSCPRFDSNVFPPRQHIGN